MTIKIEFMEGVSRLDQVSFDGTEAEAAKAAAAGLKAWDTATEARIVEVETGKVIAVVHPQ